MNMYNALIYPADHLRKVAEWDVWAVWGEVSGVLGVSLVSLGVLGFLGLSRTHKHV